MEEISASLSGGKPHFVPGLSCVMTDTEPTVPLGSEHNQAVASPLDANLSRVNCNSAFLWSLNHGPTSPLSDQLKKPCKAQSTYLYAPFKSNSIRTKGKAVKVEPVAVVLATIVLSASCRSEGSTGWLVGRMRLKGFGELK